jgi:hypothetical protein
MNVYIAGMYSQKEELAVVAEELLALGIGCTSRWLTEPHPPNTGLGELTEEQIRQYAIQDILDIEASDAVVFFAQDPETLTKRGGRHVEFGYALGKKPIYVVGPAENVFHGLNGFRGWKIVHGTLSAIKAMLVEKDYVERRAHGITAHVPDATGYSG